MPIPAVDQPECLARALALLTVADGRIDAADVERLDGHHTFLRIGLSRAHFLDIAQSCIDEFSENLMLHSWLCTADLERINRILDAVRDPDSRLLVCRLAACAIGEDGCVNRAKRMVYTHTLGHWHIRHAEAAELLAQPC